MGKYYAVLKYTKDSNPMSTGEYSARDHGEAMEILAKKAKVQSTMNLYEFQLLHIVGRDYTEVARKLPVSDKTPGIKTRKKSKKKAEQEPPPIKVNTAKPEVFDTVVRYGSVETL